MSLDRIAIAKRAVPRTGITEIDDEAVILYSCLSRMDVALSRALASDQKKRPYTIPAPSGTDRIDVTDRTSFGRPLLDSEGTEEEQNALVFKSDSSVASGALLRLAQHAAFALKDLRRVTAERDNLKSTLTQRDEQILLLNTEVEALGKLLEGRDNPEKLFTWYKASWAQQHRDGQTRVHERHNEKEAAILNFLSKQSASSSRSRDVSMFRLLYHTSEDLLANEFRPADDAEIDKVVQLFQRPAVNTAVSGGGSHTGGANKSKRAAIKQREMRLAALTGSFPGAMPDEQAALGLALGLRQGISLPQAPPGGAKVSSPPRSEPDIDMDDLDDAPLEFQGESTGGHAASLLENVDTSRIVPPTAGDKLNAERQASTFLRQLHGLDLNKAQKLRVDDFDADTQELSMVSLKKAASVNMKRAKTRSAQSVKSASLVVTFYVNKNTRKIAKLDDAGTLLYQLRNILVEAPTTYSNLVIDRATIAGKSEVLAEQAAAIHLTSLWDDICSFDTPVVRIIQLESPDSALTELQTPLVRATHVSDLHATSDAIDEARLRRMQRLKFFRNASAAEKAAESGEDLDVPFHLQGQASCPEFDLAPKIVTSKQKPGILHFLSSNTGGVVQRWVSPIQAGIARCYTSSMIDVCTPDALVTPFKDFRSPFFMTLDEPMSSIVITLDHASVVPSGYSLCSVHPISGGLYPRSWKVEASSDNVQWTLLRTHEKDESLNRYNPTFHWSLPRAERGQPYFQHFRFTQTGLNASGTNNFCVSGIELYGRVAFVEKLTLAKPTQISMKVERSGFSTFGALPAPKVAEVGGSKGKKK
jgi:hypothetical protein